MQILFIYIVLALLGMSMVITVDWLTGTPLSQTFSFLNSIFATTTLQEMVVIIVFLLLPVIQVVKEMFKKNKKTSQ